MNADLINILFLLGWLVFAVYQKLYNYIPFVNRVSDGPILMSSGLLKYGRISSLHQGELVGYNYNLIAGQSNKVMVVVSIGHNTGLHFVGVGAKSSLASHALKPRIGSLLTKVVLEGDFPKFFSLYCSKGKELELLHLFDPTDMALFADYCSAYDFELYKDSIYMSNVDSARDKNDTTTMMSDLEKFLSKNWRFLQKSVEPAIK